MRVKILAPAGFVIGYALVALPYEVVQRHFSPPTQDFPAWVIFELGAAILPFLVGTLAGYVLARAGTQDPPRSLSVAMWWFGGAAAVAAGTFFVLIQETAGLVLSLPTLGGRNPFSGRGRPVGTAYAQRLAGAGNRRTVMDGVDPEALILLGALLPVIVLAPLTLLVTVFGVCMARGEGMVRKIFRMVWLYVAATVAQAAFLASGSLAAILSIGRLDLRVPTLGIPRHGPPVALLPAD